MSDQPKGYGKYWEKYPIEDGEVWKDPVLGSMISVHDIRNGIPDYMLNVDMIYSDPPWNKRNLNAFISKAGKTSSVSNLTDFIELIFNSVKKISPRVCYLEIGTQYKDEYIARMQNLYNCVQSWEITYYNKSPCYLIRGSLIKTDVDYTGLDDANTPGIAISSELPKSVADFCMGRGLTMINANKQGIPFFGTELIKRKLAVGIQRAKSIGRTYEKI